MSKIEFINKLNKEANSMTSLKINEELIPLTEKELKVLFRSLFNVRDDLFKEEEFIEPREAFKLKSELQYYKDRVDELESNIDYDD